MVVLERCNYPQFVIDMYFASSAFLRHMVAINNPELAYMKR
jgi:hypothetical protein